jgi:hypothetical protein
MEWKIWIAIYKFIIMYYGDFPIILKPFLPYNPTKRRRFWPYLIKGNKKAGLCKIKPAL